MRVKTDMQKSVRIVKNGGSTKYNRVWMAKERETYERERERWSDMADSGSEV